MTFNDNDYLPFNGEAKWIWHSAANVCDCGSIAETVAFRRNFKVKKENAQLEIHISADADYLLYCNGNYIGRGPARGNIKNHFYDRYDLSKELRVGNNCLAVIVVGFAASWPNFYLGGAPTSRITATNAFILDGKLLEKDSEPQVLHSSNSWKTCEFVPLKFQAQAEVPSAGPGEVFCDDLKFRDWIKTDFVDDTWGLALELAPGCRPDNVKNSPLPYRLVPREIPFLAELTKTFDVTYGAEMSVKVPANTVIDFTLDAGAITTGFPVVSVKGGACKIHLFYSEHLLKDKERIRDWQLAHDKVSGPLFDVVEFNGGELSWQPFFWRAFRYVRIQVQTADKAVELSANNYIFTTYPYSSRGKFISDNEIYNRYWEVGFRTLQLCSHDIFEDCPYYERLQYGADTQIAALMAFATTGDTALTAQAIKHFRWSINDEGITAGNYPSRSPVILPLWGLHWINMIYDYYMYTGNKTIIEENLWGILRVLDWFLDKKGNSGLIEKIPYWNVADWSPQWEWDGQPPEIRTGTSSYPNLFLCACLRQASAMAEAIMKTDTHQRLSGIAEALSEACRKVFWNPEEKLYADTLDKNSFSQLTNAWAILSDVADSKQAVKIAQACFKYKKISQASMFGKYFVFQALLKSGQRKLACDLLKDWELLLEQGFTTWPEGTSVARSECHVWSSLPTIAIQQLILGFRILKPGATLIEIKPYLEGCDKAYGRIPLAQGDVELKYSSEEIALKLPSGVTAQLILPSGSHLMKNNSDWVFFPIK